MCTIKGDGIDGWCAIGAPIKPITVTGRKFSDVVLKDPVAKKLPA